MSIDAAWIPLPWGDTIVRELEAAAHAAREPIDFKRVQKVLETAWDAPPAAELDELEPEPVAVTPSAQVHRGLLDGREVAVKVLRPGVAASVRQDLALLEALVAPLGAAFPALDAVAMLREVRERVLDELDLEHEASVQRRFHRALRDHPFLTVPAPITRLSHDEVMVSEWVHGVPLRDAPERDRAAARLLVFVAGAARFGTIHADPGPDDVLVLEDGRLAILDFGANASVDPDRLSASLAALEAFAAEDAAALGDALERLGWLAREHAQTAMDLARHALGELSRAGPAPLDCGAVIAMRDRLLERPDQLVTLIRAGRLAPEDLWPARGLAEAFATIARAGATGPWREWLRRALRDGWDTRVD
jgi:predicted unusual protein kinase regulating ubiquinone biosynthesis (AarF/ABC1/UbiB family)